MKVWPHGYGRRPVAVVGSVPMASSDALDLLDRLYGSFATGDSSLWEESIADDALLIGTDPNEFWTDAAEAKSAVRSQLKEMKDAGISVRAGEPITRDLSGDTILVVDRPTIALPDGGSQQARLTVIFAGGGDSLQIKHFHLSMPASNEDVLDATLTT